MGADIMGSRDGLQRRITPGSGRKWLKWLPAVTASAVIAAGTLAGSIPARAGDPLPAKTPAQVIALMGGHHSHTFSGTLEQSSELGLPELPATGPTSGPVSAGGAASVMELLTGEHTGRIFMDGKTRVRFQMVDRMAERDVIRNGNDVWFYTSKDNSTAHLALPAYATDLPLPEPPQPAAPALPTPQEIAERFLAKADPSTVVSVGADAEVAGRAAYSLVLEPRTEATLVGKVEIAVDGGTGMPLSVQVTARGAVKPAFQSGFTRLSLEAPDQSLFAFVPPPGSAVKELQLPPETRWPLSSGFPGIPGMVIPPEHLDGYKDLDRPAVTGSGWETVVEVQVPATATAKLDEALRQDPLLSQAAVVIPGGRLLSSSLFNILLTDDGRIFAGMVPPERLQAAASAAP